MNHFLTENTPVMRTLRTIVQGLIAVLISCLPQLVAGIPLDPALQSATVAAIMAVLAPIMALIAGRDPEETLGGGEQ